ncbi:MAG: M23 family metallopeptidase [Sphingomonadaceae bacterium]
MRRRLPLLAIAALPWLVLAPAGAREPFAMTGPFTPGGLVTITLPEGARDLRVNGEPVPEASPGVHLVGFGRDETGQVRLSARGRDGTLLVTEIPLASRSFNIQRLPALGTTDLPDPQWVKRREAEVARTAAAKKAVADSPGAASGWQERFQRPVSGGRVSGVYGSQRFYGGLPRSPHWGLDIAVPTGTPVRAPASGIVRLAEGPFLIEGNIVLLDHGAGLASVYIHLHEIRVKPGDVVKQGDVLGTVGTTGRSTGPHLHWGVSLIRPGDAAQAFREVRLDPALLLAGRD